MSSERNPLAGIAGGSAVVVRTYTGARVALNGQGLPDVAAPPRLMREIPCEACEGRGASCERCLGTGTVGTHQTW